MNIRRLIHIIPAFACLMILTACQFEDEHECPDTDMSAESYINLTISVSTGNQLHTRAPLGGENGDGREAGFARENQVTGITLILYEDEDGINGINTTENPVLSFVHYYPTTLVSRDAAGAEKTGENNHDEYKSDLDEAIYTTGDQLVPKGTLTFGKSYRAIVVANRDLTSDLSTSSHLNDVKALVYGADDLYDGDYGKAAYTCGNFMMSSEYDFTFDLTNPTAIEPNKDFYRPTETNPIRIERLAARIDFWAAGATYTEKVDKGGIPTDIYGNRYGYVYDVSGTSDKFVVVSITPFNLYTKGTGTTPYGGETLLKRLNIGWLLDETTTSYVLDPSTDDKTTANASAFGTDGTYLNPLSQIYSDLNAATPKAMSAAGTPAYYQTVAAMHEKIGSQGGFSTMTVGIKTGENVIVAYPMENTLPYEATPSTPLYTYATGVAIEGDYYVGGDLTAAPTATRVYIGYLMHQSGSATYTPFMSNDANMQSAVPSTTPMNYGVVRNNIYRISIESITPEEPAGPKIKIKIEEEKWRHVDNPTIYI